MGQPPTAYPVGPRAEYIGAGSQRGEVKHLSNRRNRNQYEIASVAASEQATAKTPVVSSRHTLLPGGCGAVPESRAGDSFRARG